MIAILAKPCRRDDAPRFVLRTARISRVQKRGSWTIFFNVKILSTKSYSSNSCTLWASGKQALQDLCDQSAARVCCETAKGTTMTTSCSRLPGAYMVHAVSLPAALCVKKTKSTHARVMNPHVMCFRRCQHHPTCNMFPPLSTAAM